MTTATASAAAIVVFVVMMTFLSAFAVFVAAMFSSTVRVAAVGDNRRALRLFDEVGNGQPLSAGDNAVLGSVISQVLGNGAGVDVFHRNDVVGFEVLFQRLLGSEVGHDRAKLTNDQAGDFRAVGLGIRGVDANVPDFRIRHGNDVSEICRVSHDFLITGHARIENNLSGTNAVRSKRVAEKDFAVFEY